MIASVFEVLAKELDAYFLNAPRRHIYEPPPAIEGSGSTTVLGNNLPDASTLTDHDPSTGIIQLLRQEDQGESIKFPPNRVTPILINIEEESQLRSADRFSRVSLNGNREHVFPDVRINLYILFVSHFYDYTDALHYISLIIKYFQTHPVLTHQNIPELSEEIEELMIELITLPFSEQNEVWNALRSAYHPSLLYKVKMLVFQDEPATAQAGIIQQVDIDTEDL